MAKATRPSLPFSVLAAASLAPVAATAPAQASAAAETQDTREIEALSRLSIEELTRLTVRSASKRDEPLGAAPTALYVVTGEEILQSAATSLPEALRLAPNLGIQQVDARQYAVTARGFNSIETSNKLLVLIDGRTIYTPLHSGVFWEMHAPLLEDIDQIEIVSGPGGTLFGPNAVNGVINVNTRDARDTVGTMARASAGARERTAALRHGAALGADGAVRAYAHWFDREGLPPGAGGAMDDAFRGWQAGFRADLVVGVGQLTLQGDLFDTDTDLSPGDGDRGHNVLARWNRPISADTSLHVQAYYDKFSRRYTRVRDSLETFDAEAQVNALRGAHDLVAGFGVRTTRDLFINNLNAFQLDPESRRLWIATAFVQDRIAIAPDLALIAGLKAERSSFTGVQLLPNLRVAWQVAGGHLLWAAVSRAVRTPSRIDRELVNLPLLAPASGFRSEKLVALEAGYRGPVGASGSLSVSAFVNFYEDIRTTELSPGGRLPIRLANGLSGRTWGIEAWGVHQLRPWWRLNLGLATLWKDFEMAAGRTDLARFDALGHDPNWQVTARSHMDLTDRLQLNVGLRALGKIDTHDPVDSYVQADARIGYALSGAIELYLAGSNLLSARHAESGDPQRAQLAQRSLFAGTRLRF
jgi:iron complex outermembrane recepter protein